ncbi:MAG: hypothetical protein QM820_18980 [Minicystis sp.]
MSLLDSLMGTYEKLTIKYENPNSILPAEIKALFNPSEVVYGNQVSWRVDETAMSGKTVANQQTNLQTIQPATLNVTLLFDTYEGDPNEGLAAKLAKDLDPAPLAALFPRVGAAGQADRRGRDQIHERAGAAHPL